MDQSRRSAALLVIGGILALVAVTLFLISGAPLEQLEPKENSTENSGDGDKSLQRATIKLYPDGSEFGTHNWSEPLTIETGVDITARGHPAVQYDGAMLCFYDENGIRLGNAELGPIISPESGEFHEYYSRNITVTTRPEYVIVDHPKLRNDSIFHTEIRYWNDDQDWLSAQYGSLDEIQDQFEWPRTSEVGQCG